MTTDEFVGAVLVGLVPPLFGAAVVRYAVCPTESWTWRRWWILVAFFHGLLVTSRILFLRLQLPPEFWDSAYASSLSSLVDGPRLVATAILCLCAPVDLWWHRQKS